MKSIIFAVAAMIAQVALASLRGSVSVQQENELVVSEHDNHDGVRPKTVNDSNESMNANTLSAQAMFRHSNNNVHFKIPMVVTGVRRMLASTSKPTSAALIGGVKRPTRKPTAVPTARRSTRRPTAKPTKQQPTKLPNAPPPTNFAGTTSPNTVPISQPTNAPLPPYTCPPISTPVAGSETSKAKRCQHLSDCVGVFTSGAFCCHWPSCTCVNAPPGSLLASCSAN